MEDKYSWEALDQAVLPQQTTTRDLGKLFTERHDMLKNFVLTAASSVASTSDIWSGNTKEDYISVVAHYVNVDWEL